MERLEQLGPHGGPRLRAIRLRALRDAPDAFGSTLEEALARPGKGVGGALADAVINWARSTGVKRLLLDVADRNAPAIALYARKGFEPNGEVSTLPPPREHVREHQRELKLL